MQKKINGPAGLSVPPRFIVELIVSSVCAQDLCEGGDLLTTYHFKSELEAANIVLKVTNAVRYMHDRNIAVSTTSASRAFVVVFWRVCWRCGGVIKVHDLVKKWPVIWIYFGGRERESDEDEIM